MKAAFFLSPRAFRSLQIRPAAQCSKIQNKTQKSGTETRPPYLGRTSRAKAPCRFLFRQADGRICRKHRLSDTVPYSTWNRIAEYFVKLNPTDVDFGYNISYVGWVTSNPEAVEEVLDIKDSLRVCNQKITTNHNTSVNSKVDALSEEEKFDIVDKLHEVFSVVETPPGEFQLYTSSPEDVIVENPLFPTNKYGSGEFWYIRKSKDDIWYIRYNFRPGDDLRFNNVLIDFELKAIGKKISYDEDVAELIRRLK